MSGAQHGKPRPAPFSIRLSAAEREALEAKAGPMPLASYIKSVALAEDAPRYRKRRSAPEADLQLLAHILARLGASRLPSNLNQIAKAANMGALPVDPDLEKELRQACVDVAWMRCQLMEALGCRADGGGPADRRADQ